MNKAKCDVLLIRAIYKILKKFLNFEAIKLLKAKTTLNFANDSTGDRRSAGDILYLFEQFAEDSTALLLQEQFLSKTRKSFHI